MTIAMGRLEIETPDHVVLRFQLAGAGNRGFAAIVDFVIVYIFGTAIAFGSDKVAEFVPGIANWSGWIALLQLFLAWSYFVLLEWLWNGQTIGKRLFGLRVISEDGEPARFVAVVVRNLVRVIDFLPVLYGVGLVALVISSRSQRLGDYAGGTFVVRPPRPRRNWSALRTHAAAGAGTRRFTPSRTGRRTPTRPGCSCADRAAPTRRSAPAVVLPAARCCRRRP